MHHAEQVRILKELLRQVEGGGNADAGRQLKNPATTYLDPELAAKEWRVLFRDHPQLIGLSGDLPQPGSYLSLDDFGVPILATRDADGTFHAFVNACRHRGAQLVDERRGDAKRFVCPFHGWTYSGRGELRAVTEAPDFGPLDKHCFSLVELPACEYGGLLWVHPQPGGSIDPAALLGGLDEEICAVSAGNRVFRGERVLDKPLNWKLANDTFGETYHFKRLHRNTLGQLFHGDALCFETFGRNHRFVFPSKGIGSLRRKPESEWRMENVTTVLYYLFPNIQVTMSERQVTLFRIYPLAGRPGWSRTRVSHYFSEAALGMIAGGEKTVIGATDVYDPAARDGNAILAPEAAMEVTYSTVENEDYRMGESTQRSLESGLLDYVVFGRNEPALHHFHNTFRAALDLGPLEVL